MAEKSSGKGFGWDEKAVKAYYKEIGQSIKDFVKDCLKESKAMITKGIIKRLQENEKPYCKMDADLQKAAMEIGKQGNFQVLRIKGDWNDILQGITFDKHLAYRLKADFKQKSKVVEKEIVTREKGCLCYAQDGAGEMYIDTAPRRSGFIGFKFPNGEVSGSPVMYSVIGVSQFGYFARYDSIVNGTANEINAISVLFRR